MGNINDYIEIINNGENADVVRRKINNNFDRMDAWVQDYTTGRIKDLQAYDKVQDTEIGKKANKNLSNVSLEDFLSKAKYTNIQGAKKEIARFTASGTWVATTDNIDIYLVGGGGGGDLGYNGNDSGTGGGGGGGGYTKLLVNQKVTIGQSYQMLVGAAGTSGYTAQYPTTTYPPTAGGKTTALGVTADGGAVAVYKTQGGPGGSGGGGGGNYSRASGISSNGAKGGQGGFLGRDGDFGSNGGNIGGIGGGTKNYSPLNPYDGKLYGNGGKGGDGYGGTAGEVGFGDVDSHSGIIIIYG